MAKGILEMEGNKPEAKDSALKFLKQDESIVVAVANIKEFDFRQTVSVFDSVNQKPVILPTVVEKNDGNLYKIVLEELWNEYNASKEAGAEKEELKKILNKINAIKPQDTIYFGMTDINTGKQVVLSMGYQTDGEKKPKAGNNFMAGIKKLEKQLKKFPIEITKGSMGAWTIVPFMDDLTPDQQANFHTATEVPQEVFDSCLFFSSAEKQKEDVQKFGRMYGFDVSKLGIEETVAEGNQEGYGF